MTDLCRPSPDLGHPAPLALAGDRTRITRTGCRLLDQVLVRPLVLDAALGTRLCQRGLDLRHDDPALWNFTHPEIVHDLHRRDVAAGADAVITNTFGANRFWLARFGKGDAVESINRRAALLARRAAGPGRFVLGSVGPTTASEPGAAAEQAAVLVEAGIDALLFETFHAGEIDPVLEEVDRSPARRIPVIVSLWEWPDPPGPTARRLLEAGVFALGQNCQPGAQTGITFAESMDQDLGCASW